MTAIHADTRSADFAPTVAPRVPQTRETSAEIPSKRAVIGGRILSGLGLAFLLFDLTGKVFEVAPAVEGTVDLGYPAGILRTLGFIQLACFIVSVIPRTAVLGAILWTGYLGGAVATHVRVEHPLFSHTLFPVYIAALLWVGLWLRLPALRALVPLRSTGR